MARQAVSADLFDHHRGRNPLLRPTPWARRALFVSVNLLIYTGVNAFWRFLATGQWDNFNVHAYWRGLQAPFEGLSHPLGVIHYPWMILVFGLLMSVIVFTPIVIAVLYRLRVALLFLLVAAAVGQAPALVVGAGLGCLAAARTKLRSNLPMVAVLLGLAPMVVVIALLDLLGMLMPGDVAAQPMWRWLMYMPFFVTGVLAVIALAIILALANLARFRPGVIWPVLAVLLIGPLWMFYDLVGQDELRFALMTHSGRSEALCPDDRLLPELTVDEFRRQHGAQGLADDLLAARAHDALQQQRAALNSAGQEFVDRYPLSKRTPEVLWIMGQSLSLRRDMAALRDGSVRYSAARVRPESEALWQKLLDRYESSPQAALAQLHLAELALRRNEPQQAYALLADAYAALATQMPSYADRLAPQHRWGLFAERAQYPSTSYFVAALRRTQYLLWLMDRNLILDNPRAAEALSEWLKIDPAEEADLAKALADRAQKYSQTDLADNLQLARALIEPDVQRRADRLADLATGSGDAAIEANYERGRLIMDSAAAGDRDELARAAACFQNVLDEAPNPWHELAAQRLLGLSAPEGEQP